MGLVTGSGIANSGMLNSGGFNPFRNQSRYFDLNPGF